jgi:predicted TIM-barrel fold metal-dependent hydrolase
MIEFLFDAARAVTDLVLTGILSRYPKVRFIVTHTGGVLPLLAERIQTYSPTSPSVSSQLQSLWYDEPLPTLDPEHLLFGTGYCFTPAAAVTRQVATLDSDHRARTTANAVRLLKIPVAL